MSDFGPFCANPVHLRSTAGDAPEIRETLGNHCWATLDEEDTCVPAELVPLAVREAERRVIEAAVLWRSLITDPVPKMAEVGAMQSLEAATVMYEHLAALDTTTKEEN